MVTEKDIKEGKCGPKVKNVADAIIPHKASVVPKDKYVYQFYDENTTKYPGFHKEKTPSGMCLPCCYNNWNTETMKKRRSKCKEDENEQNNKKKEKKETYIKGPEKYPLGEFRWGYLPPSVQMFFQESNSDCYISKTNTNVKPDHTCMLRHGVENNAKQSFIACIANTMFYTSNIPKTKIPLIRKFMPNATREVPTIEEMKSIIIDAIDIDRFIKYQNGDLITSFANISLDVNIEKYANSKIYKKMMKNSDSDTNKKYGNQEFEFVKRVCQAFETFIMFLKDKTTYIDYTYLWDIICEPNPKLYLNGINLIVLEIPDDDVTNNIELVCPTNHYSIHTYNPRKNSILILKRGSYFEPIYTYNKNETKNRILITKEFAEYGKNISNTMRSIFEKIIKPTLGSKCKPLLSKPYEYRFKQPPLLDNLIQQLINKKYSITNQVLNFQGKVIGVFAKTKRGLEGFVPCYPSSLTNNQKIEYPFVYMTDDIWKSYEETLEFMTEYYDYKEINNNKKERQQCYDVNTFCKVVDDEVVVGFLTNTNQFIQINNPTPISLTNDRIKTINNSDYLIADIETLTTNKVDVNRVDFIKRIKLETNYYNVFRNTIRILFNDYSNSDKRKSIQNECNKKYTIYTTQLKNVIQMLHELVNDNIMFISKDAGYSYKNVYENELQNCITLNQDKCKVSNDVCRISNNTCSLIIPKENLITNSDNELIYYGKMADELIRYNRIKSFIFKPQSYLSFGTLKYNLRDNEMVIIQDLLNPEFFDNLIPSDINSYAKFNTFDSTQPIISQNYTNEVDIMDMVNKQYIRDCFPSKPDHITSDKWKKCFPRDYKEVKYSNSNFCGIYLIIDLVKEFNNLTLNLEQVKEDLIEEYNKLTNNLNNQNRFNTIVDILKEEGQVNAKMLKNQILTLNRMILQDDFYVVNFDLWLLLNRYQIPSIMISNKTISETRFNHNAFTCYTKNNADTYAFIVVPALRIGVVPEYKLIFNNVNNKIKIDKLTEKCLRSIITSINTYYEIEHYVDDIFEKDSQTHYTKKVQGERDLDIYNKPIQVAPPVLAPPVEDAIVEDAIVEDAIVEDAIVVVPKIKKQIVKKLKTKIQLVEDDQPKEDGKKAIKEKQTIKKASTAWEIFMKEGRQQLKDDNTIIAAKDIIKVLGEKYRNMDPVNMKRLEKLVELDKERYNREKNAENH